MIRKIVFLFLFFAFQISELFAVQGELIIRSSLDNISNNASSLPSGTYIYEIRANDFVKSGKMMLLK